MDFVKKRIVPFIIISLAFGIVYWVFSILHIFSDQESAVISLSISAAVVFTVYVYQNPIKKDNT